MLGVFASMPHYLLPLLCLLVFSCISTPQALQIKSSIHPKTTPTTAIQQATAKPSASLLPIVFSTAPAPQPIPPTSSPEFAPTPLASTTVSPIIRTTQGSRSGYSHGNQPRPTPNPSATPWPIIHLDKLWDFTPPEAQSPVFQVPILYYDNIVYSAYPNRLISVSTKGQLNWQIDLFTSPMGNILITPKIHIFGGLVARYIQAFDHDGNELSQIDMGPTAIQGMAYDPEEKYLYALTEDGNMQVLQVFDHPPTPVWNRALFAQMATPPVLYPPKKLVIAGTAEGRWIALDMSTGKTLWSFLGDGPIRTNSAAMVINNMCYFIHRSGSIHAVNSQGIHHWTFRTDGEVLGSVLQSVDGMLYAVTRHWVYQLYPNGQLAWKQPTGEELNFSSPILDNEGYIYIAGSQHLLGYSPEGELKVRHPLDEAITGGLNMDTDGKIYILGVSGRLQAYQSLGGYYPQAGWPKWMGNNRNWGHLNEAWE